ncbi:MAG: helix-turn-helix domain-containing protein [Pseudomonadota bacterium]|nr:helix-turn-helix domain-containing protein [Pseudomonadota bacterium]
MYKVAIVLIPEAFPHSVIEPFDLLSRSQRLYKYRTGQSSVPDVSVSIVAEDKNQLPEFNGVHIAASEDVYSRETFDLIWIPSLMLDSGLSYRKRKAMMSWIRQQVSAGAQVATVCTGAFLLAETGLLNFKVTTVHWSFVEMLSERYPLITVNPQVPVYADNGFYSAAADEEWLALAREVLQAQFGKEVSKKTAEMFSFNAVAQSAVPKVEQFGARRSAHDAVAEKTKTWLTAHIAENNLIVRAAKELGLSESSLARRFKTAHRVSLIGFIQDVRIERAKDALELTSMPIERISDLVGYRDSSYFRRLFKIKTGMTPKEYRKHYSA